MPDFLTDEWFTAVHEIRRRHVEEATPIPYKIRLNQVISDVPFGDGERRIFIDTMEGQMLLDLGELESPDVTLTTDYDTARKILVDQDQAGAMQAFMSGKIKVQGDMTKLMAMQAGPVDETARKVAEEIKAITT